LIPSELLPPTTWLTSPVPGSRVVNSLKGNWQEDRERALGRNSRRPSRAIVYVNADSMHFKFRFCSRGCRDYERQPKDTREQPQN
jgi:hypothetical protein